MQWLKDVFFCFFNVFLQIAIAVIMGLIWLKNDRFPWEKTSQEKD